MNGGIYYIKNIQNSKIYIGGSTEISRRIRDHKYRLRGNKHENISLQNDWNTYGENSFEFGILEPCVKERINEKEEYYINHYFDLLYNSSKKSGYSHIKYHDLHDRDGLLREKLVKTHHHYSYLYD
jgi:group I intron endonuclease